MKMILQSSRLRFTYINELKVKLDADKILPSLW